MGEVHPDVKVRMSGRRCVFVALRECKHVTTIEAVAVQTQLGFSHRRSIVGDCFPSQIPANGLPELADASCRHYYPTRA